MSSLANNIQHEPFARRIVIAMNRFASDRSTLALAIREGEAIKGIIESEKIFSSDQLRYGKLPHLKDVKYHWEQTRNDLHFLCDVGQIIPNPEFAEACLFWRLKTGRSLAE